MNRDQYDTAIGIQREIEKHGLTGLNNVVLTRSAIGQVNKDLRPFCIMGKWIASSYGTFGRIIEGVAVDDTPVVFAYEDLQEYFPKQSVAWSCESFLPRAGTCCPHCEELWTIRDCWDAVAERDESFGRSLLHRECLDLRITARVAQSVREVFTGAGFAPDTAIRMIPNLYGSRRYRGPWFLADTDIGAIRVGWRKSVIEIDWSRIGFDCGLTLFEGESVTKEKALIHAYGYEKATEYLTKLRTAKRGE